MTVTDYIHIEEPGAAGGPLFFLFHGTGGDESQFVGLGRQLLPAATLVSPRGDVSEHGAARFFKRRAEGLYDLDDLARATAKMAGFIEAKIASHRPSAVLGLGYSNGANILASVMLANPLLMDGAVLMHPLIPFEPEPAGDFEKRRILVTAGRNDPICPAPLTERLAAVLAARGAEVATEWHPGGHEIRQSELQAAADFLQGFAAPTDAAAPQASERIQP